MFNFHKDHKTLVNTAMLVFLVLSVLIAVVPAAQMQDVEPLPNQKELTKKERNGLLHYISEGCVACHTQQVRNIEMDNQWGPRPSMPSDYYYSKQRLDIWRQSPSLLGSERTGPDLSNVAQRNPSKEWHLMHLFNPRIVEPNSIMPSYPWLFLEKDEADITDEDVVISVEKEFFDKAGKKIVASKKALELVAYLQSLKLTELPDGRSVEFIPSKEDKQETKPTTASSDQEGEDAGSKLPDGQKLYTSNCAACHQSKGQGVKGAFPPLAGSAVVNDEDPEMLVRIILQGYDARSEYGIMPGLAAALNDEEIAAIVNHERTSWGNDASKISPEEVSKIREMVMKEM